MYKIRQWSVTHSRKLEAFYYLLEPIFVRLYPLWRAIGTQRVEKPFRVIEKAAKNLLFGCQMCGQCTLSNTGMSCPMNCPKSIRNGPCGGVRLDGNCEIKPEMRCVWVEAWRGSQKMKRSENIRQIQVPVNFSYKGSSSWLRVAEKEFISQNSESAE